LFRRTQPRLLADFLKISYCHAASSCFHPVTDFGPFLLIAPINPVSLYPLMRTPMRLNHSVFTRVFYRLLGRDPVAKFTYGSLNSAASPMDTFWISTDESGLPIFYRYKVANVDTRLLRGYRRQMFALTLFARRACLRPVRS